MTKRIFFFKINSAYEIKKKATAVPLPQLPQALQENNMLPKILARLKAYDSNNNMVRNMNSFGDDDLCRVCERDDRSVFCKSCGHEWKVYYELNNS
jgi:hypothetical protein